MTEPMSPGRMFVEACAEQGQQASVEYDFTITEGWATQRRKPRNPCRNMFKVINLARDPRQFYWHESPPQLGDPEVFEGDLRREAANRFHKSSVPRLLTTRAWVQVPSDLWKDPVTFEAFITYRLIFRLATAENNTILRGEGGLLNLPQIGRLNDKGPFASTLLAACNEVEQVGCTPDGLVINPSDYYRLMGEGTIMDDLERHGLLVVRTRLVDPGTAIIGDFGKGALLFDAGRSVIRFAEPPPGIFAEPGIAVLAEIYERAVVNLPATFYVVSL